MGLRETLNEKPMLVAGVIGAFALGGVLYATSSLWGSNGNIAPTVPKAFFSIDDGKTWFIDDYAKLAPFSKDGKEAVRTFVYRCAGAPDFVNHLERYKPDAKATLEELRKPDPARHGPPNVAGLQDAARNGRELKRPGEKAWVGSSDFRTVATITSPKCPNGAAEASPVDP